MGFLPVGWPVPFLMIIPPSADFGKGMLILRIFDETHRAWQSLLWRMIGHPRTTLSASRSAWIAVSQWNGGKKERGLTAEGQLLPGQIIWSQPPPVTTLLVPLWMSGVERICSLTRATASRGTASNWCTKTENCSSTLDGFGTFKWELHCGTILKKVGMWIWTLASVAGAVQDRKGYSPLMPGTTVAPGGKVRTSNFDFLEACQLARTVSAYKSAF